jgi:hypothetical protein
MEPLWKLPRTELNPLPGGHWAVQSEEGMGPALAVFMPLVESNGDWQVAVPDTQQLALTTVNDHAWTQVPFPAASGASGFLCVLRYDHPSDHPGDSWVTFEVPAAGASLAGKPARVRVVTGAQLRAGLESVKPVDRRKLARLMVPAPTVAAPAPPGAPLPRHLRFAFASCQYPPGMLDRQVAYTSYEALATHLERSGRFQPERLLLLGDQVYTDATYGLLDPSRLDDRYRIPYEEFTKRADGPFARLPQPFLARRRMTLDDHEIRDNWEPTGQPDPGFVDGVAAYWQYQRREAPKADVQITDEAGPGWRLFMADSRSKREFRDESSVDTATILGPRQTLQLQRWLKQAARAPGVLNIVTTASMLLPRTWQHRDEPLYLDAWQGYPASFHGLLAFLCDQEMRNLVFLSGDAHLACEARVKVTCSQTGRQASFASFHAPALYAPYPFANEEVPNLLLDDQFGFRHGGKDYVCTVDARVLADGRNGCGLLRAVRLGNDWHLGYRVLLP